jgi:SAM-dependent methyltransferase
MMSNIYTSGEYLEKTATWHAEDSVWKADRIGWMIDRHGLRPESIAEIGCGAGAILNCLASRETLAHTRFSGFDISPQAIALCAPYAGDALTFRCEDLLSPTNVESFDLLLVIDVFEHVRDYMGFVEKCRLKVDYKVYHIPLDIHVSAVVRNTFNTVRESIGHLHYFTADSAIATLRDTGHEIVDVAYTNGALGTFRQHRSLRRAIANVPRWLLASVSEPIAARVLGGFSLLVLAR